MIIKNGLKVYGIIYKIQNKVNGKIYIGQTKYGFYERYNNNLEEHTHNRYLKNDIKKYGINNFDINTLFDYAYCKEELDFKEGEWIKHYQSNNKKYGYNLKEGNSVKISKQQLEVYKDINKKHRIKRNEISLNELDDLLKPIEKTKQIKKVMKPKKNIIKKEKSIKPISPLITDIKFTTLLGVTRRINTLLKNNNKNIKELSEKEILIKNTIIGLELINFEHLEVTSLLNNKDKQFLIKLDNEIKKSYDIYKRKATKTITSNFYKVCELLIIGSGNKIKNTMIRELK